MIDKEKRAIKASLKEQTKKRMKGKLDPENYEYIPQKKQIDYYDTDTPKNVAIYVRVSTTNIEQTTSFELQKKYYEDYVLRHSNWTLINIYCDEGISGTTTKHRDGFNQMIADCKAGKIDMIITKSVSRFARNVLICIGEVRELAELNPPVGVFFESECIFSLNEDSQMALSFVSTMAEEESRIRSRSMETSLRMRLDNGIPLTPKLYGYTHDADGNLIINPEEAPTVKLMFYMYLYGYSTPQIAEALIALERRSYYGNINWTSSVIIEVLRNERHCGDVLTRKTYTPDFKTHKKKKNEGERPQSHYRNHHEAIVSRDDYIAVQRLLDNAKYKNKGFLPELKVISSGLLKGFVTVYPHWAGFSEFDYYQAAQSVYSTDESSEDTIRETSELKIEVEAGAFDLRDFEITRSEFFNTVKRPYISFANKDIYINSEIARKLGARNHIELLINPIEKKFAIRTTDKANRQGVCCSKLTMKTYQPKHISSTAFNEVLFSLLSWNTDYKYKVVGTIFEKDNEIAYIFDANNCEAFLRPFLVSEDSADGNASTPLTKSGNRIRAIPQEWANSFGKQYYLHELSLSSIEKQSEQDWMLRMEGQSYEMGKTCNTTCFEEIKEYIKNELSRVVPQEN